MYKKSTKFASKLSLCYKRACARAILILAKRTCACDVRAAENRVCECACVQGKKSSQLTVCLFPNCELRNQIRTRTRARTFARVRCACEKAFETCVRCACVRPFFECATCDCNFARFGVKKAQFWTFFGYKDYYLMLYNDPISP